MKGAKLCMLCAHMKLLVCKLFWPKKDDFCNILCIFSKNISTLLNIDAWSAWYHAESIFKVWGFFCFFFVTGHDIIPNSLFFLLNMAWYHAKIDYFNGIWVQKSFPTNSGAFLLVYMFFFLLLPRNCTFVILLFWMKGTKLSNLCANVKFVSLRTLFCFCFCLYCN